jgi:hypothetical protein
VALLNAEETFPPHLAGKVYLAEMRRMPRDLAPASDAAITTAVVPGAAPVTIVAVSNGQLTGREHEEVPGHVQAHCCPVGWKRFRNGGPGASM